ncbi:MAG: xanthan lyase [Bacteroidales bacterium]|nr:xanthan lyase [Bacteroidales bacterium]
MKRLLLQLLVLCVPAVSGLAQRSSEFRDAVDSVAVRMEERTGVKADLKLKSIVRNGTKISFRFDDSAGDYPWREGDVEFFKDALQSYFPSKYSALSAGAIYANGIDVSTLVFSDPGNDGSPLPTRWKVSSPARPLPLVCNPARPVFENGLQDRYIAVSQSHGRYYEQKFNRWEWQRATLFQTVEDVFTQSFVIPFLVPMLENAGAMVFLPRERDYQVHEAIVDNDPYFSYDGDDYAGCAAGIRKHGRYSETGSWKAAGEGFRDAAPFMYLDENFFTAGTARQAACVTSRSDVRYSEAVWEPEIEEDGDYAVYVSYKTMEHSSSSAHYTVRHAGGCTEFIVNQKMGGGTWIYLGTFRFSREAGHKVVLDNALPEGRNAEQSAVVTADAVKFGGGMGNVARRNLADPESVAEISGYPRYLEGARYWEQWAGVDTTVYSQNAQTGDYRDDFMSRGAWTGWLSGGSCVNPDQPGKNIPLDLSFSWHSDAGTCEGDTIVGTLSIYTLLCENSRKLPNGEDRMTCRDFADIVQSQIVGDIRAHWEPAWTRRQLWNRSYSESRTPAVPAMLLELLSHQNFTDMKFGLDPEFRFDVSRSVYKGMLKYLSSRYGIPYVVQPLPVASTALWYKDENTAVLSWKAVEDELEPTATAESFRLYTRTGDGVFDQGRAVSPEISNGRCYLEIPVKEGIVYGFRVTALNSGGESFPSAVMSIGRPSGSVLPQTVAVVDNFDRIAAPAWYDGSEIAGFDDNLDHGVAWTVGTNYIGSQYDNKRKDNPWKDDENPGFGASYQDWAGRKVKGNDFDNTVVHGRFVMASGRPFCSFSRDAFSDSLLIDAIGRFSVADLVCSRQARTPKGLGNVRTRYAVYPEEFRTALTRFTEGGGSLLISGSHIGTDAWDGLYRGATAAADSTETARTRDFVQNVLGYKWMTNFASRTAQVWAVQSSSGYCCPVRKRFNFESGVSGNSVSAGSPDGIVPASSKAKTVFRYSDTNISAGVAYNAGRYRVISLGFPLETICDSNVEALMFMSAIDWLSAE